uniref:Uncharacterized protein n=1 Tax=Solanum lycopersicum TaxID=4081 RepID=A0A3Q7FRZ6_SOLLC
MKKEAFLLVHELLSTYNFSLDLLENDTACCIVFIANDSRGYLVEALEVIRPKFRTNAYELCSGGLLT